MKTTRHLIWNLLNIAVAVGAIVFKNTYAINGSKFLVFMVCLSACVALMTDKMIREVIKESKWQPSPFRRITGDVSDWCCLILYAASGRWFAAFVYLSSILAVSRMHKVAAQDKEAQ